MPRYKLLNAAGAVILALLLATCVSACSAQTAAPADASTATATPDRPPSPTSGVKTQPPAGVGTANPATPEPGAALAIQVSSFTVRRDLVLAVEFAATNGSGTDIRDLQAVRIVLRRPEGINLLDTALRGGAVDEKPLSGLPAGMTRPYRYTLAAAPSTVDLALGDKIVARLFLSYDGHEQAVGLPLVEVTAAP